MARRTKTEKIDGVIEQALVDAFQAEPSSSSASEKGKPAVYLDVEELASRIALVQKEVSSAPASSPVSAFSAASVSCLGESGESASSPLVKKNISKPNPTGYEHLNAHKLAPANANDDTKRPPFAVQNDSRSLKQKAYFSPSLFAAGWFLGGVVLENHLAPQGIFSVSFLDFLQNSTGLSVALLTLLPAIAFWGLGRIGQHVRSLKALMHSLQAEAREPKAEPASSSQIALLGERVRSDILAMEDGIQRTLSRAAELEALVHGGVQNLERAYYENENRVHRLIKELSNEREAILNHAERVKEVLEKTREDFAGKLCDVTAYLAHDVENAAERLQKKIGEKTSKVLENFSELGEKIADRASNNLQITLNNASSTNKMLLEDLSQRFEKIHNHFSQINVDLVDDLKNNLTTVEGRAELFSQKLTEAANRSVSEFDNIFMRLETAFTERGNSSLSFLNTQLLSFDEDTQGLISRVNERFDNLDTDLLQRRQQALENFDSQAQQLDSRLQGLTNNFVHQTGETLNQFSGQLSHLDAHLVAKSAKISQAFSLTTDKLDENTNKLLAFLDGRAETISANLSDHTAGFENLFTAQENKFISVIEEKKTDLAVNVEGMRSSITETFAKSADAILDRLHNGRDFVASLLEDQAKDFMQIVYEQMGVLNSHIDNLESVFGKKIQTVDHQTRQHVQALEGQIDGLQEAISNKFITVQEALDQENQNLLTRTAALKDTLDINSQSLNEVLAGQAEILEERLKKIRDVVAYGDERFSELLAGHREHLEDSLLENKAVVKETFVEHIKTLERHSYLLKNAIEHSKALGSSAEEQTSKLISAFDSRMSLLTQQTQNIGQVIGTGVQQAYHLIEEDGTRLVDNLEQKFSSLVEDFANKTSQTGTILQQLDGQFVHKVENFSKDIQSIQQGFVENTDVIAQNFLAQVEQTEQKVLSTAQNIKESISSTANIIDEYFADRALSLHDQVDAIGLHLGQKIEDVGSGLQRLQDVSSQKIAAEITALNQSTESVYKIAAQAQQNFSQIGKVIGDDLKEATQQSLQKIAKEKEELGQHFNADTSRLLSAVEQAKIGLQGHFSGLLQNIVQTSDSIQGQAQQLLVGLEELNKSFSQKFSSLHHDNDKLMRKFLGSEKQFSGLVEQLSSHVDLLSKAASSLDHSQNNLALSLQDRQKFLRNLSKHLEQESQQIVSAIDSYKGHIPGSFLEDTSDATHKNNDGDAAGFSTLLKDIKTRFSDVTKKDGASSVSPAKTEKETQQLKVAIRDQVEALQDLTKNMHSAIAMQPESGKNASPAFVAPQRPAPAKNDGANQSSAWLSTLLQRASAEKFDNTQIIDTRNKKIAAAPAQNLKGLSQEMAQALNQEALQKLWSQYHRGKKNISEKHLYTPQGLQTFAKVKRQYDSNPDFQTSANQYMKEFEDLLRQARVNSSAPQLLQSYLMSPTGKVYTMLAHASERIR